MRQDNLKAIGIMLAGVAFFAFLDVGLKQLAHAYAPVQVMFLRAAASLPFIVGAVAWSGGWRSLRVHNPLLYLVRAALGLLVLWSFIYALSVQSLSYTYAIYMSAPLMVAALAGPFLGERVPGRRWAAIAVGLIGVVVALKPSAGFVALGGIAAAASAACYAVNILTMRVIGRTDSNFAVVFWHLAILTVVCGCLAWPQWRPVATEVWPLIAMCGLTGALGQYFFTAAIRLAPASTIAPFEYTAMLWGLLLDWLVFALLPTAHVLIGATIVIAGGLYVIWDERRSGHPQVVELPPG